MPITPKRRWFRFSLRTLFVVVTVFGIWLGYELNWIRERHAIVERCTEAYPTFPDPSIVIPNPSPCAPGMLWIFGERGYCLLTLGFYADDPNRHLTADEKHKVEQAKRLFPEAYRVSGATVTFCGPNPEPGTRELRARYK